MTIEQFFTNDKLWNDVKKRAKELDTDRLLTKSEYIKKVGAASYSDKEYKTYKLKKESQ